MTIRSKHFVGYRIQAKKPGRAFTLIELLVVIAIIALLVSILLPSLTRAKDLAKKAVCKTSIRCLSIGNELYQFDHTGFYAPAAAGIYSGNLHRWFGSRLTASPDTTAFLINDGPLMKYLPGETVKICPSFVEFNTGFESGCGGFGYNQQFVGSFVKLKSGGGYEAAINEPSVSGNRADAFVSPSDTVAFTDSAFANGGLTEYSFCEPPWGALFAMPFRPSIHFRHIGVTDVAWLDSHVSEAEMDFTNNAAGFSYPGPTPKELNIGFFGENNTKLFDLE